MSETEHALWFDGIRIAMVSRVTESDGTKHGLYLLAVDRGGGHVSGQVLDYVEFCIEWNRRVAAGEDVDAGEFEAFGRIVKGQLWKEQCDGQSIPIEDAPMFLDENEATWRSAVE